MQARDPRHKPESVALPVPGLGTPSEPTAASWGAWLAAEPAPSLPTPRECRDWLRRGLASAADPATAAIAEEAAKARPHAFEPMELMEAAHTAGWKDAAPSTYVPAGDKAHAGSFKPANIDALFQLHKQRCAACTAGEPCYGATGHNFLNDFPWPFVGDPPAGGPPPPPQPYDPELAALLKECIDLGVLVKGDPATAKCYATAFNAPRMQPTIPEEAKSRLAADGSGRATAEEASKWASGFVGVYKTALASTSSAAAAWQLAWQSAGVVTKNRLVIDLSYLNDATRDLPMRYANLTPLLAGCKPGARFGKKDLAKGFWQIRNGRAFLPYAALRVMLEPEGPPECLFHDRFCMGGKPIPWAFSLYTGFIREAVLAALPPNLAVVLIVYLDDLAFRADNDEDWHAINSIISKILETVGAQTNPAKGTLQPATEEEVLGLELRSEPPSVRLPIASEFKTISLLHALLQCAEDGVPVPVRALASLAGRLAWRGNVDNYVPANTRAISRCTSPYPSWWRFNNSKFEWSAQPEAAKVLTEMRWLVRRAASSEDRAMRLLAPPPKARVLATSDASGPHNVVTVALPTVAFRFILRDCTGLVVPVMESLAMPLLVAHAGAAVDDVSLLHGTDCLGAAYWLVNGKAKRDEANDLQRLLTRFQEASGARITEKWLTRSFNYLSDRGCSAPWRTLLEGELKDAPLPPRLVEVMVEGLPHEFLSAWARHLYPEGFEFSAPAWQKMNPRGARR